MAKFDTLSEDEVELINSHAVSLQIKNALKSTSLLCPLCRKKTAILTPTDSSKSSLDVDCDNCEKSFSLSWGKRKTGNSSGISFLVDTCVHMPTCMESVGCAIVPLLLVREEASKRSQET